MSTRETRERNATQRRGTCLENIAAGGYQKLPDATAASGHAQYHEIPGGSNAKYENDLVAAATAANSCIDVCFGKGTPKEVLNYIFL